MSDWVGKVCEWVGGWGLGVKSAWNGGCIGWGLFVGRVCS